MTQGFTQGFGFRWKQEDNRGLTKEQALEKKNWRRYRECKLCGGWFCMPPRERHCIWCRQLMKRDKKEPVQKSIKNFGGVHA